MHSAHGITALVRVAQNSSEAAVAALLLPFALTQMEEARMGKQCGGGEGESFMRDGGGAESGHTLASSCWFGAAEG